MRVRDSLEVAQQEVLTLSEAILRQQQALDSVLADRDGLLAQLTQQRVRLHELEEAGVPAQRDALAAANQAADVLASALAETLSRCYWDAIAERGSLGRRLARRWPRLGRLLGCSHDESMQECVQVRAIEASTLFDGAWYLRHYPDVAQAGLSPALHYLRSGAQEGRDPGPMFSTQAYLAEHAELATSSMNPLIHCLAHAGGAAK